MSTAWHSHWRTSFGLAEPAHLEQIVHESERLAGFDAVFVPGGHAPLVNLPHRDAFNDDELNVDFGALLAYFHARNRPTGLICHAPAALAAAPKIDGWWIYVGCRMTCFKTVVDTMFSAIPAGPVLSRPLEDGSDTTAAFVWRGSRANCTADGEQGGRGPRIDDGQDPYSAKVLGTAFVESSHSRL